MLKISLAFLFYFLGTRSWFKVQYVFLIRVDDRCVFIIPGPYRSRCVIQVYMSMNMVRWLVFVHQCEKRLESGVDRRVQIPLPPRRRVSQKNIKTTMPL